MQPLCLPVKFYQIKWIKKKVCSFLNLQLYLNIPETPHLQASALNRFIRGKGHSSCKQRKQHIEFLFIFCLLKNSNMAVKDIKYQYSTSGSRSWSRGVLSPWTTWNKTCRGTFRFPLSCFNQGYNTLVLNNGGIIRTLWQGEGKAIQWLMNFRIWTRWDAVWDSRKISSTCTWRTSFLVLKFLFIRSWTFGQLIQVCGAFYPSSVK